MKTIIKGATIVYGSGLKREDILIGNGKIESIRPSIRSMGEERVIDAVSFYALPGFLAKVSDHFVSDERGHGVTTFIRRLEGERERKPLPFSNESFPYDYVYQASLERLSMELVEEWRRFRVKVASVASETARTIDWDLWQPRLQRFGMVLEAEQSDDLLSTLDELPVIVPFSGKKKPIRPRVARKVTKSQIPDWEKIVRKDDPFVLSGYWIDTLEYELPRLTNECEAEAFLIRLVKTRASVPAKIFGVYPQKGSLSIGADADILLVSKDRLMMNGGALFQADQTLTLGASIDERKGKERSGRLLERHRTYAFSF